MGCQDDRAALASLEGFFVDMYAVADPIKEGDEEIGGMVDPGDGFADFLSFFLF